MISSFALAFGLFAMSLNLLVGYTGMISFGHGMFFGLGRLRLRPHHAATVCRCRRPSLASRHHRGGGTVIGAICVRLNEIYFAFVTLAFQMLILQDPGLGLLHGRRPRLARRHAAAEILRYRLTIQAPLHLCCAVLFVACSLMRQIVKSPFGYTLRMIRDNPERASFLGIDVWRAKLMVFVISALFAPSAAS